MVPRGLVTGLVGPPRSQAVRRCPVGRQTGRPEPSAATYDSDSMDVRGDVCSVMAIGARVRIVDIAERVGPGIAAMGDSRECLSEAIGLTRSIHDEAVDEGRLAGQDGDASQRDAPGGA